MARILDFYGIAWEYEPHTFPILWNLDGDVVESFSPDFYLAELDLYLEMTTLRQKLVRKKNRKLRRLRELYPDVRIKLFYARDFRALMLKYGKLALADALSGTAGQAQPPDDLEPDEKAIGLIGAAPPGYLGAVADVLAGVEPWTAEGIGAALDRTATAHDLNRKRGWQPVRAAVTGSTVSPPLDGSLELLGKERTVKRLRAAA